MSNSKLLTQESVAQRIVELFATDPIILAQGRAFGLSVSAIESLRQAIATCGHPDAEMVAANIKPLNK